MKINRLTIFFFFINLLILTSTARTVAEDRLDYVPGKIFVKFKSGVEFVAPKYSEPSILTIFDSEQKRLKTNIDSINMVLGKYDVVRIENAFGGAKGGVQAQSIDTLSEKYPQRARRAPKEKAEVDLSRVYKIVFSEGKDLLSIIEELKKDPYIEDVSPSYIVQAFNATNDPFFTSYGSWGQDYYDLWGLHSIGASEAWDISTGSGLLVAVIDSGVDFGHEDISTNVWINSDELPNNNVDDDNNGYIDDYIGWDFVGSNYLNRIQSNNPYDYFGHGSHVAGIISARGNNSKGIVGLAYDGKIMILKGLDNTGFSESGYLADAIEYAVDNGADIINMSWGWKGLGNRDEGDVKLNEAIKYAYNNGCILIAAAGNANTDEEHFPAISPYVISVAATDHMDERGIFNKYQASNYGDWIDISAPGTDILSLRANGTWPGNIVGNYYYRNSGTSMAAPYVSGLAALILSINNDLTHDEVKRVLESSSEDIGDPGKDIYFGAGRINVYKALRMASLEPHWDRQAGDLSPPDWVKNLKIADVAVDQQGNRYVLYTGEGKIKKFDMNGNKIWEIGKYNDVSLKCPLGIAIATVEAGEPLGGVTKILVADTYNDRVVIFKDYGETAVSYLGMEGNQVAALFVEKDVHWENWFNKWGYRTEKTTATATNEGFCIPIDVAFLNNTDFIVADYGNRRVLKFKNFVNRENGVLTSWGIEPSAFDQVIGDQNGIFIDKIVVNPEETGGVVDRQFLDSDRIGHIGGGATIGMFLGGPVGSLIGGLIGGILTEGLGGSKKLDSVRIKSNMIAVENSKAVFTAPISVASNSDGIIYVVDNLEDSVNKFAPAGSYLSQFGSDKLSSPWGIAIDGYGNVFVADSGNNRIAQFASDNSFVREFTSEAYTIYPYGICARDGKLYIADAKFSYPLVWAIGGAIQNFAVNDSWFSPNGDGNKDSIKISYNLTQPADITIQSMPKSTSGVMAMSASTTIVMDKAARSLGRHEEAWDGKVIKSGIIASSTSPTSEPQMIAEGQYQLKIIAAFGDYIKTKTVDINVDTTKPTLALNRDPPGISPNGDNINDSLIIDYSISDNLSPTSEVKLSLWKNGKILDVLLDEEDWKTVRLEDWKTYIWHGKIAGSVMEGNYILELKAADLAGNTATLTREVLVDLQPPKIEGLSVSNEHFSPNGDGNKDETEIKFNLYDTYSEKMMVTVLVADKNGNKVATISKQEELSPGEHKFVWKGNNETGKVGDAEYLFKVYAEDLAGNLGTSEPVAVVVDTIPPAINTFLADPNPFTPNNDGIKDKTLFSYAFSEPCNAELRIYRDDGITLFRDYRHYNITNGSFNWDGSGVYGEILGEEHPYCLYAEDRAGNVTTSETRIIIVDYSPSLVPYAFAEPDPFSPVNPNNNFTEIKYYLSRDDLLVNVAVVGREGRMVKSLIDGEIQDKGEHSVKWYGDFDSSYDGPTVSGKVADGSWEFKVKAAAGDEPNSCNTSNTVLVDNVPPHIMVAPVEVDTVKKTATLKYSVPETVSIEIAVFDSDDNLVSSLEKSGAKAAGSYSANWQPDSDMDKFAYFKISAVDAALNQDRKTTELFSVRPQNNLQITSLYASPASFTPNGDGHTDLCRISYQISGGAPDYKVTIDILNTTGATIKRLIENETQAPGIYSFYWDGKDDSGLWTKDGNYEYVVMVEDKGGGRCEARGAILLVSTRPSVDLSASLPVFSPNGDSSKDTVTFNYSIDYPIQYITGEALVKLEVLNATGEAVWSRIFNHTAGSYAYEYDGLAADGLLLTAGDYYVRISAQDALGSTAVPKSVALKVDCDEPVVAIQSIAPNPFSPYLNGVKDQTVISYTLAKSAYVTVKVKQGDALVKTLQSNQWTEAFVLRAFAIPTVSWDGRNESGSFVADGSYTVEISAIDSAGNSSSVSQNVLADNTEPAVPGVDTLPANTNQGLQNITGSAEPNSLVKVYINDNLISSGNASASGVFNIPTNLFVGANNLKLTATDAAGNTSNFSPAQMVKYETDAPVISNLSAAPNPAKAGPVYINFTVSETLESEPIVKVNSSAAAKQQVNNLTYTYIYNVEDSDKQGAATLSLEVKDLAGNITNYQSDRLLIIDTVAPIISNEDIKPEYAGLGALVTIDFNVDEALWEKPEVKVGSKIASFESEIIYSADHIAYAYSYAVAGDDADGAAPITIRLTDLAGNETYKQFNDLTIDKTKPAVIVSSIDPNPASVGEVKISFTVSEALKERPVVYVTQNGASSQSVVVSGDFSQANGQCEAIYNVVSGYDGQALISIEATDLANNLTIYQSSDLLTIDTIAPTFGSIQSEISSNPDFSKYAKEGSIASIRFEPSEALKFNPEVKVNSNPANYESLSAGEYIYSYMVTSSDTNGNATISISGYDFAGNEGIAETSSSSESFVIDLVKPTVTISSEPGMIANPSPFSTNASGEAGHRQTRLSYEISENGYVTIGIHKVPDTQTTYVREDFNDNNLVISFDEKWLTSGAHYKYWDGTIQSNQAIFDKDGNGYADPGKYAFIVEVKDMAGNLVEGKWGGTCWIQDNVLILEQPDQTEIGGNNPRPGYFSPNGDGSLDSTTVWFRVRLGVTPAEPWSPEKIGVFGIPSDFAWVAGKKLIGTYTVKVYNENKSALIRTIVKDKPLDSNIIISETWDGKNDAGGYVPEGNYKIEIDARDFIGGQAENNLLTLTVAVDKSSPRVVSSEPDLANTPWRNSSKTYNVDFFDDHNAYASKLNYAQYKVTTGISQSGSIEVDWTDIFSSNLNAISYTADWGSGIFGQCGEGTNYVSVRVFDNAGNQNTVNDVFYVKKDTAGPTASAPSTTTPTNNKRPTWSWTASADMSGIQGYYIKVTDSGGGTVVLETWVGNNTFWTTTTDLGNGTYYASIKAKDNAGNTGSYGSAGQVTVDILPPQISGVSDLPDPFSPGNVDGNKDSITFYYAINESSTVSIYVDGSQKYSEAKAAGSYSYTWSPGSSIGEGVHSYYVNAVDGVGNSSTSSTYNFTVDNTPPSSAPSGLSATSGNGVANLSWNSVSDADGYNVYRSTAYNGSYSKVNSSLVAGTSYQDTGLTNATRYWYKVKAADNAGNESGFSRYVAATPGILANTRILYTSGSDCKIYILKINDLSQIKLTDGKHSEPAFSPDGSKIAFRDINEGEIYIMNPDGTRNKLTDSQSVTNIYPRFSPDGSEIIFTIWGPSSVGIQIGKMDVDGKNQQQLTSGPIHGYGSFSPDGKRIVFYTPLGGGGASLNIYTMDSNGNNLTPLVIGGPYFKNNPSFSPDGTKVVFSGGGDGASYQIYIVSDDGTNLTKLTDKGDNFYPSFSPDGTKIVFSSNRDSNSEIYIMNLDGSGQIRITNNSIRDGEAFWSPFAPGMGASSVSEQIQLQQSTTLEPPTLIEPRDEANITSLRPTFKWKHRKGNAQEYRFDLAKNDAFSIAHQSFSKSASAGSQDKDDTNLYHYTYSIHEFDPGLDRDTYYWKVTALATSEAATSEVWSFTVAPQLTLTGVTNYPNPFNPNSENTSIRYRLGADADEVKIRIYDITGSLVREIINCPTAGEGASVWDKYQDVEWDGRSGRGDMVVNGIYPFEVIARSGDKTLSGRGKIAVLK